MTTWQALTDELDRWTAAGKCATFWWRDDDAVRDTDALRRLLALRARHAAPLALAVIPAHADETLAGALAQQPDIAVLQHGFAHRNHAAPGADKSELGPARPRAEIARELAEGRTRLAALFGAYPGRHDFGDAIAVLVPPWNRISDDLVAALPEMGYGGLSTFSARRSAFGSPPPAPGLIRLDAHIDIVEWAGTRGFAGEAAALGVAVDHLATRRGGETGEPTGLLTHHLAHDEPCWSFIDRFLDVTRAHPGARWLSADQAFARH